MIQKSVLEDKHTHFLLHLMLIKHFSPEIDPLACNHKKNMLCALWFCMLHKWVTDAEKVKTVYDGNKFRKHLSAARNQVENWNVSIMHSRVSHKYVLLLSKERNRGFFQMCRWNQDIVCFFFHFTHGRSLSLKCSFSFFPFLPSLPQPSSGAVSFTACNH